MVSYHNVKLNTNSFFNGCFCCLTIFLEYDNVIFLKTQTFLCLISFFLLDVYTNIPSDQQEDNKTAISSQIYDETKENKSRINDTSGILPAATHETAYHHLHQEFAHTGTNDQINHYDHTDTNTEDQYNHFDQERKSVDLNLYNHIPNTPAETIIADVNNRYADDENGYYSNTDIDMNKTAIGCDNKVENQDAYNILGEKLHEDRKNTYDHIQRSNINGFEVINQQNEKEADETKCENEVQEVYAKRTNYTYFKNQKDEFGCKTNDLIKSKSNDFNQVEVETEKPENVYANELEVSNSFFELCDSTLGMENENMINVSNEINNKNIDESVDYYNTNNLDNDDNVYSLSQAIDIDDDDYYSHDDTL